MKDSVKSRSQHLILSSSPTPFPWGYDEYLQDSRSWAQLGMVDNIITQLYRYDYSGYQSTLNQSLTQIRSVNPDIYFAGVLTKAGTYVITPSLLSQKIQLNRVNNVKGECTFFYEALRANNNQIGELLKIDFYNEPALVPYRNGKIWRPKATIKNENEQGAVTTGTWSSYPQSGFNGGIIRTNETTSYASIEYNIDVPFSAHFDIYGFMVPNSPWTQNARYVIYSDNDSIEVIVNQADFNRKGWQKIGTVYLTSGNKKVMKIDNTYLGTGKYLIADAVMMMINRKLSPDVVITGIKDEQNNESLTVAEYWLSQNYPNPFNPVTIIKFSVPIIPSSLVPRPVSLKVFDVLGREIATLINEEKAPGSYEVKWDATNFSSGVYFYRLSTGGFNETRKMILLR
jgi:hypothetical protein